MLLAIHTLRETRGCDSVWSVMAGMSQVWSLTKPSLSLSLNLALSVFVPFAVTDVFVLFKYFDYH